MNDNHFPTPEHLALATHLVEAWADSRSTQAEASEWDLALWIVERLALAWDVGALIRGADALADRVGGSKAATAAAREGSRRTSGTPATSALSTLRRISR